MLAERSYPADKSQKTTTLNIILALLLSACSSKDSPAPSYDGKPMDAGGGDAGGRDAGGGEQGGTGGWVISKPDASSDAGPTSERKLIITPGESTITIAALDPSTISFTAALSDGSQSALNVTWSSDQKSLGELDAATGMFKPSGAAGLVHVTARAGALTATVAISLAVSGAVDGDPDFGKMPEGAGGLGGVGGEGGGSQITDTELRAALDKPASEDAELVWLYPYDGTVWPRGLPAPLLQWRSADHAAQAVKLHLQVDAAYSVDLYLGRPNKLASDKPIERLPLPQQVWRNALESGAKLSVTLTIVARESNGDLTTFRAKQNPSWKIAPATLRGTVYYNSYATKLAENFTGAMGGDGRFGGATLAIRGGVFDPVLVAGSTTTDASGCRVCHVVSSDGATLIAQHAANLTSSRYDLRNANAEKVYPTGDDGKFGWAALSADGALALGSAGPPGNNAANAASRDTSALYKVADGTVLTSQGLSEFVTQAATPTFSHDGNKVAFNLWAGPGTSSIAADGHSLVVMDFEKVDDSTYRFSKPTAVYTSQTAEYHPAWPYFLPDGSGLVFSLELSGGLNNERFVTRDGARSELWWTDLSGHAHALDAANGKGYLPTGPNLHDADATLQYEPTVAPLVAGGYAWVVFTSRRMYGNVATRGPFESDPRQFDLTASNPNGPTTKKLWVSAIDMPPKPGADPSHPAFYLPAQELYAGNTRGFWALDACKPDHAECTGGDECCNGFCRRDEENLTGVCMDIPNNECAKEYDKCNVTADCCKDQAQPLYCVAGRCSVLVVPQ